MKNLACLLLLNFLLTLPAYATEAPGQTSSLEKLFSIIGMDQQMAAGFESMQPLVEEQAAQLQLSPIAEQELINIYKTWFSEDLDQKAMQEKIIQLYADTFSEKEIKQLIDFYQSPVGRKLLKEAPRLTQTGMQIGLDEARSKQYKLQQRLQPFLDVHARK